MHQGLSEMRPDGHSRPWAEPDTVLQAVGAILLVCAPVLPGPSRLVVLPALLAPGYALLRLLGQEAGWRSVSIAVAASLTITACAALLLDVTGVGLGAPSLGPLLGALTALFLAGTCGLELAAGRRHRNRDIAAHRSEVRPVATTGRRGW